LNAVQESFLNKPPERILEGRSVVLTRAAGQSSAPGSELERLGACVISFPTIEIREPASWVFLDRALSNLGVYDWLLFTSANAVGFFIHRVRERGISDGTIQRLKIGAVGSATRSALEAHGLVVTLQPSEFSGRSLVDELRALAGNPENRNTIRVLVPSSNLARAQVWEPLAAEGIIVDVVEAYRNVDAEHSSEDVHRMFNAAKGGYIVFASPSAIVNLAKLAGADDLSSALSGTKAVCIGPTTTDAARQHGIRELLQPEEASSAAIVKVITEDVLSLGIER
jgi:uroporphyrinogen III methyltransferase/synthase